MTTGARRRRSPRAALLAAVLALAGGAALVSAAEMAERLVAFVYGEGGAGVLPVVARVYASEHEGEATVELLLPTGAAPAGTAVAADVAVVLVRIEGDAVVHERSERLSATGAGTLVARYAIDLPDDVDQVVAGAVLRPGGEWGVTVAEWAEPGEALGAPAVEADLRARQATPPPPPPLRLLPPRRRPVSGQVRLRVLVSSPDVARIDFELDGEPVATASEPPFETEIDFGAAAVRRSVRAAAYDAAGVYLGDDRLTVNAPAAGPAAIVITTLRHDAAGGTLTVAARLDGAAGEAPAAVDFYLGDERFATVAEPPYRAHAEVARLGPQAFVRVEARFADGTHLEDARLVAGAGAERVDVNLVELFAVVTDRQGVPREGLARDEFTVRLDGVPQPIERFGRADAVALNLGLVIDSSRSMWALMPDTRAAGARFLLEAMREGDRAFLVDFDTRPRLAAALTPDVGHLMRRFAGLRADGYTALFDAVIFSLLQFEEEPGRKALVVLTDGDDYRSRFSSRRCERYGRELGVPVYIIALGGLSGERQDVQRINLESIARATGGRVFYIDDLEALTAAYDRIGNELRNQYLLAFTTERPLSADELAAVSVSVRGRGLRVRTAAATTQR